MDRWDLLLLAAAGYVAVLSLVRLMARRRNELVDEVRGQIAEHQRKQPEKPSTSEEEPSDQNATS